MILHRLYWTDTQHPKKFFEVFFIVLHGHLMTDRNWIVKGSKIRDTNAFIAQKTKKRSKMIRFREYLEAGEVVPMTDKKELDGRNYLKMISASGHLSLILETPGSIGAGLSMINGDFYLLREAELKKGCKKVKTEIFRNFQSYQLYIPFLIC